MSAPRKPWSFVRDEALSRAVAGAIAADLALDRAAGREWPPDTEGAASADRRARDRLLGVLAAIAAGVDCAVILPDGSIVCRALECDGLAIVPPDRVIRLEGP